MQIVKIPTKLMEPVIAKEERNEMILEIYNSMKEEVDSMVKEGSVRSFVTLIETDGGDIVTYASIDDRVRLLGAMHYIMMRRIGMDH